MFLMVQGASAWNGSGSSGDPYLIASPADWETFATSTDEYSDTFFKLTADITVTTMRTETFSGTFDGGGHTLTFNYTATGNNAAPFAYITGATIKNLRVAGTINTGYKFAAGIAAECGTTTITNCQSSVTINSSVDGDGTHGGLIGCQSSGTLTINSCLFDGELMGAKTTGCGGFVGWVTNIQATTLTSPIRSLRRQILLLKPPLSAVIKVVHSILKLVPATTLPPIGLPLPFKAPMPAA